MLGDRACHVGRRRWTLAVALAAAVAVLGTQAELAFGHAAFLGSSPQPGTRLETTPQQVVLTFTEPLNGKLSRVALKPVDGGAEVPVKVTPAAGQRLLVRPTADMPSGAYRVEWHSVSTEDGHALQGTFSFGVRAAAAGGTHSIEQSPLARDGWIRVLARAAMYTTLLLFVGVLLLRALLCGRRRDSWLVPSGGAVGADLESGAVLRRERSLVTDLGLLAGGAAAAAVAAEAADAAGGLSPVGLRDFLLSNVAGLGRAAVVLLVILAGWIALRWPRAAVVPAGLSLAAVAGSGHAGSATPRLTAIVLDWVHLLAAAVWLGGIALIVIAWGPALRRGGEKARLIVAREVLPVFGRVALPAFLLVAMTGLASAVIQLGEASALWTTPYGRVLALKMGLVTLIAAASYVHAFRLRPRLLSPHPQRQRAERRHWRLIRAEPVVGLGVVVAAAVLVTFPLPPRQLDETDEAQAAVPPCDPCPLPTPADDQLAVAEAAGSSIVAAWIERREDGVRGELRVLDIRGKPSSAPVRVEGGMQTRMGPGQWRFQVARAAATLRVATRSEGRWQTATLAARWRTGENRRARQVLERAEQAMRRLRSFRETEQVRSGLGTGVETEYRGKAPDRLSFSTDAGVEAVSIGRVEWQKAPGLPWQRSRARAPFRLRSWFRWTPYATAVRLLTIRRRGDRRVAELALMDPGTPVWHRLVVSLDTGRVLRARVIVRGNFTDQRFDSFNRPVRIRPPEVSGDGRR
jgi:copper transport protein